MSAQSTMPPTLSYGYGPYSSLNRSIAGSLSASRSNASSGLGSFWPNRRVCGSTALYSGSPLTVPDAQLEHAVRGGGQVRHHRAALAPAPRGGVTVVRLGDQAAVRQRGLALGDGDRELVGGEVLRRVVHREPCRRSLRLVDDVSAVVCRDPAVLRVVRVEHVVHVAAVDDPRGELAAPADAGVRRDRQLLPLAREGGGAPFTVTLSTFRPRRSRLKLERSWVARAVIVTSPSSCSFWGS